MSGTNLPESKSGHASEKAKTEDKDSLFSSEESEGIYVLFEI